MCGIWFLLNKNKHIVDGYNMFDMIKNRGPDKSIYHKLDREYGIQFGFHRLSIMDLSTKGDQPFRHQVSETKTIYTLCNGEIYNYRDISTEEQLHCVSGSDCEVIPLLYIKYNFDVNLVLEKLKGEFAFIIIEICQGGYYKITAANDRFGVRPLFMHQNDDILMLSSEIKGLIKSEHGETIRFPPRNYCFIENKDKIPIFKEYYNLSSCSQSIYDIEVAKTSVKYCFEKAVRQMVDADRNIGCLLSGGLDSSLVSSCVSRILKEKGKKLRTFSIGLPGATDEYYAKLVSKHINSNHTHFTVSEKEFIECVPDVIRMIESYDITTVRASTAQYMISKKIAETTDVKVLLCGDGSDELTGGYLYFHKAPSDAEFDAECRRLLEDIHLYDGLRADRCIAGHGLEARFPFLDNTFVETYLSIDANLRRPKYNCEKWLLRESFKGYDYLPDEVLFRTKCAFSDGCSSEEKSWFKILQDNLEDVYSQYDLDNVNSKYSHLTPYTKESLYMRDIFCNNYGRGSVEKIIKYFWMPKWCGDNVRDPSARTLEFHSELNTKNLFI